MAKIKDLTQAGKSVSALEFGSLHMQVFRRLRVTRASEGHRMGWASLGKEKCRLLQKPTLFIPSQFIGILLSNLLSCDVIHLITTDNEELTFADDFHGAFFAHTKG